jgi:site-specific recombinase XerD
VNHAAAFREYNKFCDLRDINPLERVPHTVNLFLLTQAQKGVTLSSIESKCAGISFCFRFFLVADIMSDPVIAPVKKFVFKVCPKRSNMKAPFGAVEVRKMWNKLESKYSNLSKIPIVELRSFVMAVTQYSTFCRFSDLSVVKLDDVVFNIDYFKIVIQYSKTDQAGHGQESFILRSADSPRDAHMLMCVYLQRLDSYNVQDMYLFPPLV